jgi:RimJ/RimL family protein N-acetyltransferase
LILVANVKRPNVRKILHKPGVQRDGTIAEVLTDHSNNQFERTLERFSRNVGKPLSPQYNSAVLTTSRLRLRLWRSEDLEPFAALNADPRVREFFPSVQSYQESADSMRYICDHFARRAFGLWAVEVIGGAPFIGFIGLAVPSFDAPFMPCVELGYRLAFEHWGRGYATEGARAALAFGFETLDLPEIVAMTAVENMRSRRVIERLGMRRNAADDFDHPNIVVGHPLRRHVLYRLTATEWRASG